MSERENFLTRWSRRKQAATQDAEQASADGLPPEHETEAGASHATPTPERTEPAARSGAHSANRVPAVDLSQLPPIESISAQTDISAFLAPGVPAELTHAALRRAWAVDPRIRDFIGPSESSWDFNAPDAMGGFGPLEMTDELRRQLLQMIGRGLDAAGAAEPSGQVSSQASAGQPADHPTAMLAQPPSQEEQKTAELPQPLVEPASDPDSCAEQETGDRAHPVVKRSHGGALPN